MKKNDVADILIHYFILGIKQSYFFFGGGGGHNISICLKTYLQLVMENHAFIQNVAK